MFHLGKKCYKVFKEGKVRWQIIYERRCERAKSWTAPRGASSWCDHNCSFNEENPVAYSYKKGLPTSVLKVIEQNFQGSLLPSLLNKCLHGRMQNSNESMKQLIWCRCSKAFIGADTVKIVSFGIVTYYNDRNEAWNAVLKTFCVTPGAFCKNAFSHPDKEIKSMLRRQRPAAPQTVRKDRERRETLMNSLGKMPRKQDDVCVLAVPIELLLKIET